QLIELELEEENVAARLRQPLLRVAIVLGADGVARVAGVDEADIGHHAAHDLVELFVTQDRSMQRRAPLPAGEQARELAPVSGREGLALILRMLEIALQFRRVEGRIKIGE